MRKKSLWNISYKHYKVRVLDLFFRLDKYSDSISERLCNILEHLCLYMKLHVTSDSLKNNVSFMLVYQQIRLLLWYLTYNRSGIQLSSLSNIFWRHCFKNVLKYSKPECFGEIPEIKIVEFWFSKVTYLFSIEKKTHSDWNENSMKISELIPLLIKFW